MEKKIENLLKLDGKRLYAFLSNIATGIAKRTLTVSDVEMEALGYTSYGNRVHVASSYPSYEKMTPQEVTLVKIGVTVHEALHQVFTNFKYMEQKLETLRRTGYFKNPFDEWMFLQLENLVEDPAIEQMAPQVVGGVPLKALKFTIRKIDEVSGYGKNVTDPLKELMDALVQYGDVGLVRNIWKFPEARKVFLKLAPLFYDAVNEPDGSKRIDAIPEMLEIVREIYPETPDIPEQDYSRSKTPSGGKTTGKNGKAIDPSSSLNRKRRITIKKVKREEYERMKKEAEGKPKETPDPDSDITVIIPEDEDQKEEKGDGKKDGSESAGSKAGTEDKSKESSGNGKPSDGQSEDKSQDQESDVAKEKAAGNNGGTPDQSDGKSENEEDGSSENTGNSETAPMQVEGSSENDPGLDEDDLDASDDSEFTEEESEDLFDDDEGHEGIESPDKGESFGTGTNGPDGTEKKRSKKSSDKGSKGKGTDRNDKSGKASEEKSGDVDPDGGSEETGGNASYQNAAGQLGSSKGNADGKSETSPMQVGDSSEDDTESDEDDLEDSDDFDFAEEETADLLDEDKWLTEEELEALCGQAADMAKGFEGKTDAERDEDAEAEKKAREAEENTAEVVAKALKLPKCMRIINHPGMTTEDMLKSYPKYIEPFEADIEMLKEELREIFFNDGDKTYYARSGKVSLKRVIGKTATTRLFERKERSKDKASIAVHMLVDMSESTSGQKIEQERLAAILTAETLNEFGIPFYATGFTANWNIEHTNFVCWDNAESERASLLGIKSGGGNADYFAIRTAEERLKERPEKRKLMIVISDGLPCPIDKRDAEMLNAEAVAHAKENGIDVVAFGVGGVSKETFEKMYGKNSFIDVSDPMQLFNKLSGVLRTVIDGENEEF